MTDQTTETEKREFIAAPSPTEQAASTGKPPRARVEDAIDPDEETAPQKLERKRDYLEGFLQKKPENVAPGEPGGKLHDAVIAALSEIYDPEIPVNIYDLGLIYGVDVDDEAMIGRVAGRFTCASCDEGYHEEFKQTARTGVCDKCGGTAFKRRADDTAETARARLAAYHAETAPLIAHYQKSGVLETVDAMGSIASIAVALRSIVQRTAI